MSTSTTSSNEWRSYRLNDGALDGVELASGLVGLARRHVGYLWLDVSVARERVVWLFDALKATIPLSFYTSQRSAITACRSPAGVTGESCS
jgi:hypothetical protein